MAKKKAPKPQQQLTPEKYIRTKGRNLPVVECVIAEEWNELGRTPVVVARQHVSGNYTVGLYIIDTWCRGVKDSHYRFNIDEFEYAELKNLLFIASTPMKVSYNEVHNLIYGALSYAEDLGIQPDKNFALTCFLLEEDTDDIPLIEYEYGKDGVPFLFAETELEADACLSILEKNGHFVDYTVMDDDAWEDDDEWEDDDAWEEEDEWDNYEKNYSPSVKYNYIHPEYPKELHLTHTELQILLSPKNNDFLSKEEIDKILALPRETEIADLKQLILYEIGRCWENIEHMDLLPLYSAFFLHTLFLLGELRAEESLDTVFEVMRQNDEFREYHFGDSCVEIFPLTLYYVGGNQLSKWQSYIEEPDLDTHFRSYIFLAIHIVLENEPERRDEIVDWCRDVLNFFLQHTTDSSVYDARLISEFVAFLVEMDISEVMPELEELYKTDLIYDLGWNDICDVREHMFGPFNPVKKWPLMDIYERYNGYRRKLGIN